MKIFDYTLTEPLKTDNSGFAKWGFATKNGREYFIKEFLSPVYPYEASELKVEQVKRKEAICEQYEQNQLKLFRVLNQCSDGNLVRIEQFFRYGSKYYITMRKIPALEWKQIDSMTQRDKEKLCKVLAHAIGEVHQQGIVHGDLKPDNILLHRLPSGNITVKIIDIDSSFWEISPPTETEEVHGDLVYMAPETFLRIQQEEGRLTRAIDVYALGLIFHRILSGHLPQFNHKEYDYPFEALLCGDKLKMDDSLSVENKCMIEKMLTVDAEKRLKIEGVKKFLFPKAESSSDNGHTGERYESNGFFHRVGDL